MITDSAASGTAFAAGHKSYNGAISVTPEGLPVGSILEAAKLGGLKTGLVSTTSISDATPAGIKIPFFLMLQRYADAS
jgi:alkaline phosphatase